MKNWEDISPGNFILLYAGGDPPENGLRAQYATGADGIAVRGVGDPKSIFSNYAVVF